MIKSEILDAAIEDIESALSIANAENDLDYQWIDVDVDEKPHSNGYVTRYDAKALMSCIENPEFTVRWSYELDTHDSDVVMWDLTSSVSIEELADRIIQKGAIKVQASTYIAAADDDEFDSELINDEFDSEFINDADEDNIDNQLDDIADNIEDIQDTVDDIQEDDVSIDTDNNIANHYIAECDNCHSVFITAVLESDQTVEKISGICPICEKETDQYLRWVIKEV